MLQHFRKKEMTVILKEFDILENFKVEGFSFTCTSASSWDGSPVLQLTFIVTYHIKCILAEWVLYLSLADFLQFDVVITGWIQMIDLVVSPLLMANGIFFRPVC